MAGSSAFIAGAAVVDGAPGKSTKAGHITTNGSITTRGYSASAFHREAGRCRVPRPTHVWPHLFGHGLDRTRDIHLTLRQRRCPYTSSSHSTERQRYEPARAGASCPRQRSFRARFASATIYRIRFMDIRFSCFYSCRIGITQLHDPPGLPAWP